MSRFISVFKGDLELTFWKAAQQADSLEELVAQDTYQSGKHFTFGKKAGDRLLAGSRKIKEESTGEVATVRHIQLANSEQLLVSSRDLNKEIVKSVIKSRKLLVLFFSMLALTSCHFTGKLTRRYKSFTSVEVENIGELIKVDAYVIEKEGQSSASKKTIFDLAPRAQEELIEQIGQKESESSKLTAALASPLSASTPPNIELVDLTKFDKRVVVTIRNISHAPADRISKINVDLKLDDKLRLLSCNRLATEFQTIDLGKLNFSNSNSAEIAGNLSTGLTSVGGSTGNFTDEITNTLLSGNNTTNTGSNVSKNTNGGTSTQTETGTSAQGLSGKLSASRSFAEEVLLKQRMVVLNASITANVLSLYQESISGIDLTGNIIADIVFDGNSSNQEVVSDQVYSFSDLMARDVPNTPDKIKVKEIIINYFNFTDDLKADITFEADYRKVYKGDQTISESDDRIGLLYGKHAPLDVNKKPVAITLLRKEQLMPKIWVLMLRDKKKSQVPVDIISPLGKRGILQFYTQADYKNFVLWLIEASKVTPPSKPAGANNYMLTIANGYKLIMPDGFSIVDDLEVRPLQRK